MWRNMGWKFKREGTHVYLWLIDVDIWQKPTKFCKAIILQLKINKYNLKNRRRRIWAPSTVQPRDSGAGVLQGVERSESREPAHRGHAKEGMDFIL